MILQIFYKGAKKIIFLISRPLENLVTRFFFICNKVSFAKFTTSGVPHVAVAMGGNLILGSNFSMNNGIKGNPIGANGPCVFFVDKGASLTIGNNVGMSQAAIICHQQINIGDDVKIGGGVCIYDTDFHSLNPQLRRNPITDFANKAKKSVFIGNNVFIGAHSIILKGVTIGDNSIIGAGSVVAKSIPANQIWAGNPAKFIKEII